MDDRRFQVDMILCLWGPWMGQIQKERLIKTLSDLYLVPFTMMIQRISKGPYGRRDRR